MLTVSDEHVLGYEIMNEPWCGDVYEDPTLLMPGVADRRYLQPMYDVPQFYKFRTTYSKEWSLNPFVMMCPF